VAKLQKFSVGSFVKVKPDAPTVGILSKNRVRTSVLTAKKEAFELMIFQRIHDLIPNLVLRSMVLPNYL